jgi:hypothetical protein
VLWRPVLSRTLIVLWQPVLMHAWKDSQMLVVEMKKV